MASGDQAAIEDALRRGMMAIQQRRPDEAERIARDVLARQAQNVGGLHLIGLALLAQGRARDAVAPLETAARLSPVAIIETHLAIALRQCGRSAGAVTVLERAVTRRPAFPLAFHELGVLLFTQRRLAEAEAVLKRGLAAAPGMAELSVILGGILLDRADWKGAKDAFARVLASTPRHPSALFGLGTALMESGEFAAAAEQFRQALAVDPAYAQARLSLGSCLLELGQRDEGIACIRAAVKATPQLFAKALRTLVMAGRGQFWLKPSVAAEMLRQDEKR
jgi:tetratricopeptide (TPR) repeat protein